ncbi:MAG: flagellar hook protein [Sulfurimonas sp.]|nr:MAG: flagellar hook protein [Sulfurimonas sp.]
MPISSLGVGSSILTQDVLDQLRAADEAKFVTPVELSIANEGDKKNALEIIDANMTNLRDSIGAIKNHGLFDERTTSVNGASVTVSASANTDIQEFTLDVQNLATKQIEESGAFTSGSETIAGGAGSMNLNIDGQDFTIDYDATTTLDDLKNAINDIAGDKVDATVVQINSGEFRLFISSSDTGSTQDISLSDNSGNLSDTRLTGGMSVIQSGVDANFTFNGQAITRTSNTVDDLIVGLDITLHEVGSSQVNVEQNRDNILEKMNSFVDKYNATMNELNSMTKSSTNSDTRGIFSNESTIKNMKRTLEDMIASVGGGAGSMIDYGFDVDKAGTLSFDAKLFEKQLDTNPRNVEAFLAGGTFTNTDGSTIELDGAFTEFSTKVEEYTKYNATLDQFDNAIRENLSTLEDRKQNAIDRLDGKYEILKKQYAAYDSIINRYNSVSAMFTSLTNAERAANA